MHGDVPFANKEIGKLLEGLASREREREEKKGCSHPHEILYSCLLTPESGKLATPRAVSQAA